MILRYCGWELVSISNGLAIVAVSELSVKPRVRYSCKKFCTITASLQRQVLTFVCALLREVATEITAPMMMVVLVKVTSPNYASKQCWVTI